MSVWPVVQVPLGGDLIHAPTGAVLVQPKLPLGVLGGLEVVLPAPGSVSGFAFTTEAGCNNLAPAASRDAAVGWGSDTAV